MAHLPLNGFLANFAKSPSIWYVFNFEWVLIMLHLTSPNLDRKWINKNQHEIRAYKALAIHLTAIIKILNLKNMKTIEKCQQTHKKTKLRNGANRRALSKFCIKLNDSHWNANREIDNGYWRGYNRLQSPSFYALLSVFVFYCEQPEP